MSQKLLIMHNTKYIIIPVIIVMLLIFFVIALIFLVRYVKGNYVRKNGCFYKVNESDQYILL